MPDPTTPGSDDPGEEQRAAPPRRGAGRAVTLLGALLVLLLVAGVVTAVVFGIKLRAQDREQQDQAKATTVASQFALRMDQVDGTDFSKYLKGINELLTTKAQTKNSQTFAVLQKTYEAAKVKGTGKVLLDAVASYDPDSATVLVVHDASVTTTQGDIQHHYRWSVDLVKVGGQWLVDDFSPVN